MIEIAIRLEETGAAFYEGAAETATSPGITALFHDLAEQEVRHRRAFQAMGRDVVELALSPDQWADFQAYVGALLQQNLFDQPHVALSRAIGVVEEGEALRAALGFEKETLLFYYELREALRGEGQLVLDDIIQEEKRHIRRLSGMLPA
jgi:rubrerythrin